MMILAYVPFRDPLWGGWNWWYLMIIPLALLLSLVYKSIRCNDTNDILRQACAAALKMLGAFVGCAIVLYAIMAFMER